MRKSALGSWYWICVYAAFAVVPVPAKTQERPPGQLPSAEAHVDNPALGSAAAEPNYEGRIARLEDRLELSLALKDERIQSIDDRSENIFKLLQLVGALAGASLLFFSLRDVFFRWREAQRQRSIDDIVKDTMNLQKSASQQQVELGAIHLSNAETNVKQQADGLQNVNRVIEVVRQTLAFRLEQEKTITATLDEIQRMKAEQERSRVRKLAHVNSILNPFKKMNRMQFASLTDEQYKRGLRLQSLVNDNEFLGDQGYELSGSLLYVCGVLSYYDNDVIEARELLDRAAASRAPDHEGTLKTSPDYRARFAFIHYFQALVHKNWGELARARQEIEQSATLLEGHEGEFLAPVTRAEILSYTAGDEDRCRTALEGLLRRAEAIQSAGSLNENQSKLRNRMLVLIGNTYFVRGEFNDALAQYCKAISFNPRDYYALASAAQCEQALGSLVDAREHFRACLLAVEASGDIRRKRERITRAVIAVIAAGAARECGDAARFESLAGEARELLSGALSVADMSPKFFSPATKRLVDATHLLLELDPQRGADGPASQRVTA